MDILSSGIDRVRAYALAAGVRAGGAVIDEPQSAIVKWRSVHEDKLYQVYVNYELAGVTADFEQRCMIVSIQSAWSSAMRIEVFAVEPSQANVDFSEQIQSRPQAGRVELSWIRQMSLPFEGTAEIYSDGGSGEIDYVTPISKEDIQLWPSWRDKIGLGLGQFGEGNFGYDGMAAIGFGMGLFGEGAFGFDADEIVWVSGELKTGKHKFAAKIIDRFGQISEIQETGEITVIRTATPADGLEVSSYDKTEDRLMLSIG